MGLFSVVIIVRDLLFSLFLHRQHDGKNILAAIDLALPVSGEVRQRNKVDDGLRLSMG